MDFKNQEIICYKSKDYRPSIQKSDDFMNAGNYENLATIGKISNASA